MPIWRHSIARTPRGAVVPDSVSPSVRGWRVKWSCVRRVRCHLSFLMSTTSLILLAAFPGSSASPHVRLPRNVINHSVDDCDPKGIHSSTKQLRFGKTR